MRNKCGNYGLAYKSLYVGVKIVRACMVCAIGTIYMIVCHTASQDDGISVLGRACIMKCIPFGSPVKPLPVKYFKWLLNTMYNN